MTEAPAPVETYTSFRWCDRCRRTILTTVEMQTSRPAAGYRRARWDEAARREAEAKFHREHAETCGRRA